MLGPKIEFSPNVQYTKGKTFRMLISLHTIVLPTFDQTPLRESTVSQRGLLVSPAAAVAAVAVAMAAVGAACDGRGAGVVPGATLGRS